MAKSNINIGKIDLKKKFGYTSIMTNQKLIEILKRLLKTDTDFHFLLQLKTDELERLVACIRNRIEAFDNVRHL